VETCLILPLALSSQLGGWLVLTWDVACPCNGDLIDQLGSALPTLAIALRQYYQGIQLDNLQTALEQRDQQLQHSLGQQRRLQAQTQKQVAQLRYVNQLKDDFLNTTSHELRTPLTSMTLAIRMLRRTDITPERHLAYLDILEQQCNREIALINDLIKLRQLEANELSTQVDWVQPKAVLEGLLADHQPYFQKASLSLQLTLPQQIPPLQTDPDSLWQILNELLINARKYAQSGSTVDLTVEVDKPMSSALKIMVSNWGTGILPEEIPFIFDKFRRGRDATQQAIQGTGLGLALVKALVTSLNSTITVNSQPVDQSGTWLTQFVLLIPLRQQGILPLAEG
ncbi:MAG: HAMP domain-containing sensor histidine kinase, partial [Cyanobacteria bacterium J06659_2]